MNYRTLGKTGLRVAEVGFGGWAIGGNSIGNSYGWTSDNQSVDAVKRTLELGGNFFDTADEYGFGHSEELLGVAFGELGLHTSEEIVVATKVGSNFYGSSVQRDFSPTYIRFAADQSLRRLARLWIDLYQYQNPSLEQIRDGGIFAIMNELQQAGKVRHWGVTVSSVEAGLAAVQAGAETVQIAYNVLMQEAARQLFAHAQQAGVGILTCQPLANGLLSGKYEVDSTWVLGDIRNDLPRYDIARRVQAAEELRFLEGDDATRTLPQAMLRFVLDNPAVGSTIVGIKTPAQAEENLAASDVPPIGARERRLLDGLLFSE